MKFQDRVKKIEGDLKKATTIGDMRRIAREMLGLLADHRHDVQVHTGDDMSSDAPGSGRTDGPS